MLFRIVSSIGFLLGFGSLAALIVYLGLGLMYSDPILATTSLPMGSATARLRIDTSSLDYNLKPYEIVVETSYGSAEHTLWIDWGPAQRTSLYRTKDDWLVVLGGGGTAEMFMVVGTSGPRWVPYQDRPTTDGRDWTYLGAFDTYSANGYRRFRWYPTGQFGECFPMYGAGDSPYRKDHQHASSC